MRHASATHRADRAPFQQVEDTLGCETLSKFCKEIFREALTRCACIVDTKPALRDEQWQGIYKDLEEKAREPHIAVPQAIAIRRAVAMMQLRRSSREPGPSRKGKECSTAWPPKRFASTAHAAYSTSTF